MHHLFPNITVFVYSSMRNYVEDVKSAKRLPSNIVWAIDFGVSNDEIVLCDLNLALLNYVGAKNHLEFCFPYEPAGSFVARYHGELSQEQKELYLLKCQRMIEVFTAAPGYSAFDPSTEHGKIND